MTNERTKELYNVQAYDRYKNSVINFEGKIARPYLGKRLVKAMPSGNAS